MTREFAQRAERQRGGSCAASGKARRKQKAVRIPFLRRRQVSEFIAVLRIPLLQRLVQRGTNVFATGKPDRRDQNRDGPTLGHSTKQPVLHTSSLNILFLPLKSAF